MLKEIEKFLTEQNMNPTDFGRRFMSDPMFVFEVRKGRMPYPATKTRLKTAMDAYRSEAREKKPAERE